MAHILIADDEGGDAPLLVSALEPLAAVTTGSIDGALRALDERAPDLAILDLRRRPAEGLAVLAKLRTTGAPRIPVIVLTQPDARQTWLEAAEAGADDRFEAPIDLPLLTARAKALLAQKFARDALEAQLGALIEHQAQQRAMTRLVVHDLRTPLMVVSTSVSYLAEATSPDAPDALEAIADATECISRTNDLVTDVLSISRLEPARTPLDRAPIELAPLVQRLMDRHGRQAKSRRVELTAHTEPIVLSADGALLRRTLDSLLDGSVRQTPSGGRIELHATQAGTTVRITVSSSAPPSAVAQRLYFCERAVEAHDGHVRLEETPAWPTLVTIELPAD